MRFTLLLSIFAGGAISSLSHSASASPSSDKPMNVLLLIVDDLNTWLLEDPTRYAGKVVAPNIQRLSKEGVLFHNAYTASPVCCPSRTAFLSGVAPWKSGVSRNGVKVGDSKLLHSVPSLFKTFHDEGYWIAKFGKVSHGYDTGVEYDAAMNHKRTPPPPGAPLNGIARSAGGKLTERDWGATHLNEDEMSDKRLADAAIEALQRKHDKPFFISCGLFHPHYPWYVPQKYLDMYPLDEIKLPPIKTDDLADIPDYGQRLVNLGWDQKVKDKGLVKEAIRGYLASVSFSDAHMGRVLKALDESPYRENTIVILISDHGFHLGEKQNWTKGTLWEEATDSVMMWRVPGVTQPDNTCTRPVSLLDIYPTLVDLNGIEKPNHLDGHSLLPLLKDVRAPRTQPAITTYDGHMSVRTENARFIRYWDGTTELYDRKSDPHEWTNQTNNPQFAALKSKLARLLPRKEDVVDPLPSRQAGAVNSTPRKSKPTKREKGSKKNATSFDTKIRPFLDRHCVSCHGPDKQKSDFRVDTLNSDFLKGPDVELWQEVLDMVNVSEMLPDDAKSMPTDAERSAFSDALTALMRKSQLARRSTGGQNVLRRLTAYEYNNTLRDLLGLDLRYATVLPPEGVAQEGFQNNVSVLGTSAMHLEYFESIARAALSRIILVPDKKPESYFVRVEPELAKPKSSRRKGSKRREEAPNSVSYTINRGEHFTGPNKAVFVADYGEQHETGLLLAGNRPGDPVNRPFDDDQKKGGAKGDGRSGYQPEFRIELHEVPYDKPVRVRIRASAVPGAGKTWPRLSFELGSFRGAGTSDQKEAANIEITSTKPQTYEFVVQGANFPFQSNNPRRPSYFRIFNDFRRGTSNIPYNVLPKLDIDWVEITCNYYESWPTPQYKAILPASELRETDEVAYAREVLAKFMPRAYRRPVDDAEINRKVALFQRLRKQEGTFEKTIISTLTTVLCSPNFLLISEPAVSEVGTNSTPKRRPLNDFELASRLSYFLWSSMPDEALFELAAEGQLTEPKVLSAQVQRMIADPKIEAFSRNFATQWLDLDGIYRLAINPEYFGFPEKFKPLFAEESVQFIHHVLTEDLSVSNFIDSDFALLHPRLAKHYRIPGISGGSFRAIQVAPEHHRGGIMTHASMLFTNSTGAETHPIRRGVWVLERMLDDPPPPPPPNVPDLPEPEATADGKLSLKERLIAHANIESCRDCHSKIDPWGVAFENYNALGQWREGKLDPLVEKPHQQVDVDATTRLRNGKEIKNLTDLQKYILTERQDQFRRAVVSKVMAYSLGRYVEYSDRAAIDKICDAVKNENDSFQAIIKQITLSQPFLTK